MIDDMTPDEALRLAKKLNKDFRERHPAQAAAREFVDVCQRPAGATFAAEKAAATLFVRFGNLCELFESAPVDLTEYFFRRLLEVMQASYDLGMHCAPDGRKARSARHDLAGANFTKLIMAVLGYLEAHPELEPKASEKFANIIREDILELLGKPRKADSKVSPSIAAIVTALRAVRKKSFVL